MNLLAAVVAAMFSVTAIAPVAAADRPDASKKAQDKKKDAKKKGEKKAGGTPAPKAGWDQGKNKKQ